MILNKHHFHQNKHIYWWVEKWSMTSSGALNPERTESLLSLEGSIVADRVILAGFESCCGNFTSEIWQFRLPRFAKVLSEETLKADGPFYRCT